MQAVQTNPQFCFIRNVTHEKGRLVLDVKGKRVAEATADIIVRQITAQGYKSILFITDGSEKQLENVHHMQSWIQEHLIELITPIANSSFRKKEKGALWNESNDAILQRVREGVKEALKNVPSATFIVIIGESSMIKHSLQLEERPKHGEMVFCKFDEKEGIQKIEIRRPILT